MIKNNPAIEKYRHTKGMLGSTSRLGNNGLFFIPCPLTKRKLKVVASDGMGWEHVSVSLPDRDPLWKEMCFIKDIFWDGEEVVLQYHPKKSEYVNLHKHCLHLWRPAAQFPVPPSMMVGPKS